MSNSAVLYEVLVNRGRSNPHVSWSFQRTGMACENIGPHQELLGTGVLIPYEVLETLSEPSVFLIKAEYTAQRQRNGFKHLHNS